MRGASADILLTRDNPLEDLSALKDVQGVMVRGKWLSTEDINDRLKEIAAKNK